MIISDENGTVLNYASFNQLTGELITDQGTVELMVHEDTPMPESTNGRQLSYHSCTIPSWMSTSFGLVLSTVLAVFGNYPFAMTLVGQIIANATYGSTFRIIVREFKSYYASYGGKYKYWTNICIWRNASLIMNSDVNIFYSAS